MAIFTQQLKSSPFGDESTRRNGVWQNNYVNKNVRFQFFSSFFKLLIKLNVFQIGVGQVIKGWEEGVLGMCVGEKRQLIVPPGMKFAGHCCTLYQGK